MKHLTEIPMRYWTEEMLSIHEDIRNDIRLEQIDPLLIQSISDDILLYVDCNEDLDKFTRFFKIQ